MTLEQKWCDLYDRRRRLLVECEVLTEAMESLDRLIDAEFGGARLKTSAGVNGEMRARTAAAADQVGEPG